MQNISGLEIVLFCVALALIGGLFVAWRNATGATPPADPAQADEMRERMAELAKLQGEMTGRMQTMAEVLGSRQADLLRGLSERMDGLGHRIGQSMTDTTRHTQENLARLNERLVVIDTAQKNIVSLSTQVVELQKILGNKQTRGAFGQARMEAIIQDALPSSAYAFQKTLSNGTRPDCIVHFPNGAPPLVIDAKFPLEAWNAIRAAKAPDELKYAEARFKRDTLKHVQDIADRYLLHGETQDTAFMFVPSESIFADIHERYEEIIQRAHRARVVIVSPSLLMLSVQVVQSVLRDARMREQAHVIQDEVVKLTEDVSRLGDRVRALQTHHGQAGKDLEQILISTEKLVRRGARIEALDLDEPAPGTVTRQRKPENDTATLPFRQGETV